MTLQLEPKRAPQRILLTPAFWVALGLLGCNDHWLKGAGLLPGWLTGKLSDFAGLYVAPALLASLLGVRSRRAWLWSHLLTGAVFSAIKLDGAAADALCAGLRMLSLPSQIVSDPLDLLALPMLVLSYRAAPRELADPAQLTGRRHQRLLNKLVYHMALLVGWPLCVATSAPYHDPYTTGPHLHNASDKPLVVELRPLRGELLIDCDAISMAPGRLLPSSAFDTASLYSLAPRQNLLLAPNAYASSRCGAVRVSGTGLQPVLVFWAGSQTWSTAVPNTYKSPSEYQAGAIIIERDSLGAFKRYTSIGGDYVFKLEPRVSPKQPHCAVVTDDQRVVLTPRVASGSYQLVEANAGPDGCFALALASAGFVFDAGSSHEGPVDAGTTSHVDAGSDAGAAASPDEDGGVLDAGVDAGQPDAGSSQHAGPDAGAPPLMAADTHAFLCLPEGSFPFKVGELLSFNADSSLPLSIYSQTTGDELTLYRGAPEGRFGEVNVMPRPDEACGPVLGDACTDVFQATLVAVSDGTETAVLHQGEMASFTADSGGTLQVRLVSAGSHILSDPDCRPDVTLTTPQIELLTTLRARGAR